MVDNSTFGLVMQSHIMVDNVYKRGQLLCRIAQQLELITMWTSLIITLFPAWAHRLLIHSPTWAVALLVRDCKEEKQYWFHIV